MLINTNGKEPNLKLTNSNYMLNYYKQNFVGQKTHAYNSTYKELAVQRLNESLCLESRSVLVASFSL